MLSDQQNRQEQIHDCPCNKHPAFLQNHPEIFKATKKITSSVKFIYSEKVTKFCSTYSQKLGEDFAKFCGLLRIYEL